MDAETDVDVDAVIVGAGLAGLPHVGGIGRRRKRCDAAAARGFVVPGA